jgi:hypothetical protein
MGVVNAEKAAGQKRAIIRVPVCMKVFEGCAPKCFNSKRSNLDQIVDTAFILPRGDYRDG